MKEHILGGPDVLSIAVLRSFKDLARPGIITTDAALVVRSWNRSWRNTGQLAADVIGRRLVDVVPNLAPSHGERIIVLRSPAKAASSPNVPSLFDPGSSRRARARPKSARITPLDDGGTIVGTLTIIDDVSERVASERELRSRIEAAETARAIAEDAVRVKDEFLATLSHEIRTPLNAVLGWTKILLGRQVDPAMLTRALQVIDRNAVAQTRLIDDMLDMARIMSGKLRLDMQPVDLAAIALAAIDVVSPTAAAQGDDAGHEHLDGAALDHG